MGKKKRITEEEKSLEKNVLGEGEGFKRLRKISHSDDDVDDEASIVKPTPAWDDEDDNKIEIPTKLERNYGASHVVFNDALRSRFVQKMGVPTWAKIIGTSKEPNKTRSNNDDDSDDILQRCGNMIRKTEFLKKGELSVHKVSDLSCDTRTEKFQDIVEFHPSSTVALVAGRTGTASIVQVDGVKNNRLQSVKFLKFPIYCGHFSPDGEQFIVGSKFNPSFYYYDMIAGKSIYVPVHQQIAHFNMSISPDGKLIVACGKDGCLHLFTGRSKEWIGDLKMNGQVSNIAFNTTGSRMFSYGVSSEIYEWDMTRRCCVNKFYDQSIEGTCITISPDEKFVVTGDCSGAVNLYQYPFSSPIESCKIFYNLVTPVSTLRFNSTTEILAMSSRVKENALKLVHFPSMTVFSNFPGAESPIQKPQAVDFSPSSGFFSVVSNSGRVLLYRLSHFKNY